MSEFTGRRKGMNEKESQCHSCVKKKKRANGIDRECSVSTTPQHRWKHPSEICVAFSNNLLLWQKELLELLHYNKTHRANPNLLANLRQELADIAEVVDERFKEEDIRAVMYEDEHRPRKKGGREKVDKVHKPKKSGSNLLAEEPWDPDNFTVYRR